MSQCPPPLQITDCRHKLVDSCVHVCSAYVGSSACRPVYTSACLLVGAYFHGCLFLSYPPLPYFFLPSSLRCLTRCFLSTRPHTVSRGYCISCGVTASSVSFRSGHGGHPAAPRLACRLQPEQHGPARAVRPLPQPRPEASDHV